MPVYFGFTYCPDVCPTDLQAMGLAIDQLGAAGDAVQPVFITVDPERDTPGHLKDYMPLFHQRFVGLTGDAVAIEEAARARVLQKGGARGQVRLHGGPLRLHLPDRPRWRISWLLSSRYVRGAARRGYVVTPSDQSAF
jgi:hypothetical protein